jgi:hypothetical protein
MFTNEAAGPLAHRRNQGTLVASLALVLNLEDLLETGYGKAVADRL